MNMKTKLKQALAGILAAVGLAFVSLQIVEARPLGSWGFPDFFATRGWFTSTLRVDGATTFIGSTTVTGLMGGITVSSITNRGNTALGDANTDVAVSSGLFGVNATPTSADNVLIRAIGAGTNHSFAIQDTAGQTTLFVEGRGRVAIGRSNGASNYILEVTSGNAADYVSDISNTNTTDSYGLRVKGGAASSNTNEALTVTNAAGTKRFAVTGAGNVVVGDAVPGSVLDVVGDATIRGQVTTTSSASIKGTGLAFGVSAGSATIAGALFAGTVLSTQAVGAAGAAVEALCVAGSVALGGGCDCNTIVGATSIINRPSTQAAGALSRGWTCQVPGGTGGQCIAYAICSRLQ